MMSTKKDTQCRELRTVRSLAESREGCQWQALPSPVQCEVSVTGTRNLPVTASQVVRLYLCTRPALPCDVYCSL